MFFAWWGGLKKWHNTFEFNWYKIGASGLVFKLRAEAWGASTKGIDTLGELNDELYQGKLVMALVNSRSPFCNSGSHAILLYNYQPGGYVSVYDPYNAYNNGVYSTSSLWHDCRSYNPYDLCGGYAFYSVWK